MAKKTGIKTKEEIQVKEIIQPNAEIFQVLYPRWKTRDEDKMLKLLKYIDNDFVTIQSMSLT
jgi:hypothetical protein